MAIIKTLKDLNGEAIMPKTVTSAILDENDVSLSTLLENKQDKIIAGDGITIDDDGKTINSAATSNPFIILWAITNSSNEIYLAIDENGLNKFTSTDSIFSSIISGEKIPILKATIAENNITANKVYSFLEATNADSENELNFMEKYNSSIGLLTFNDQNDDKVFKLVTL